MPVGHWRLHCQLSNANQWLLYKWPTNRLFFALVLDVILLTLPTQFNRIAFVQLSFCGGKNWWKVSIIKNETHILTDLTTLLLTDIIKGFFRQIINAEWICNFSVEFCLHRDTISTINIFVKLTRTQDLYIYRWNDHFKYYYNAVDAKVTDVCTYRWIGQYIALSVLLYQLATNQPSFYCFENCRVYF